MSEQLLYALSTLGNMSLDKFYSTFDAIQSCSMNDTEIDLHEIRRRSIRSLDSLGHCEFDFEKRYVYACPPAIVSLPVSGLPHAVLCGARTPAIVKRLEATAALNRDEISIKKIQQAGLEFLLPEAIIIESISLNRIQEISRELGIASNLNQPASWVLANFSPSIKDIIHSMNFESRDNLNWYIEYFSPSSLRFSRFHDEEIDAELVSYTNPVNQQKCHLIWEGQNAATIDRDWGRYIVLFKHEIQVIMYDERHHRLAVPATVPLPRFLGRGITLCSGLAPSRVMLSLKPRAGLPAGHTVDVYDSVPPAIASIVADKLSQDLIRGSIVISENGVII